MRSTNPDELMPNLDYAGLVPAPLLQPPPVTVIDGATSHLQVPYAECLGWRPLRLDLHLPRAVGRGPCPVVVYVHGGSFLAGVPGMGPWHSLPARGIAVACVSYRFSGEASFPEPVEDVRAAVAWVKIHADRYELDPDRVALWGSSAGGYLAALAAVRGNRALGRPLRLFGRAEPPVVDHGVTAVVTHYAVTAPQLLRADAFDNTEDEIAGLEAVMANFFGAAPPPATAVADHVEAASSPPFLLMHGDSDRRVGMGQSVRLAAALTAAGVGAEVIVIAGGDHGSPHFEQADAVDEVERFLRDAWGGQGEVAAHG